MRDLDFLYELGSHRTMSRGWRQHLGPNVASNLEHTMRVVWVALMLSRKMKQGDENLIIKMALVHDLAESRTSDLSYVQKVYVKADEMRAAPDMFKETSVADYYDVLAQYEKRDTIEAKIVKDADNLDIDLELAEIDTTGSKMPQKWAGVRKFVRNEKLYTDAAKELWDEIQKSDVANWHLVANKWLHVPSAGK